MAIGETFAASLTLFGSTHENLKPSTIAFVQANAAKIAITGRSLNELHETAQEIAKINPHVEVLPIKADVTNVQESTAAVENVIAKFGRIDVLVNNSGVTEVWCGLVESDIDEWCHTIDVNLKGPYIFPRTRIL